MWLTIPWRICSHCIRFGTHRTAHHHSEKIFHTECYRDPVYKPVSKRPVGSYLHVPAVHSLCFKSWMDGWGLDMFILRLFGIFACRSQYNDPHVLGSRPMHHCIQCFQCQWVMFISECISQYKTHSFGIIETWFLFFFFLLGFSDNYTAQHRTRQWEHRMIVPTELTVTCFL